jgi:hypothetical protein
MALRTATHVMSAMSTVSVIGAVRVLCEKAIPRTAAARTLNTTVSHKHRRLGVLSPFNGAAWWSLMTYSLAQLAHGFYARLQWQGQRNFDRFEFPQC